MRSETKRSAWQTVPARVGVRHCMLNCSQFNRSLVLVGLVVAAAMMMIALQPAHDGVGIGEARQGTPFGPLAGRSILHFP